MTIATIRQGFLNKYLGITVDGDTIPWTSADRDIYIGQALQQAWPDIGKRVSGVASSSQASDVYTIPAAFGAAGRISRIELEYVQGGVSQQVDRVIRWRYLSDTTIRVHPLLATIAGLSLRFYGFVPFAVDASDLPSRLEPVIAMRAAAITFGVGLGQQANAKRQQGLDQSRVVDYQTLVGASAYWERRYFEQVQKDPAQVSYAPRYSRR